MNRLYYILVLFTLIALLTPRAQSNPTQTLLERLLPGLKISSIGTSEAIAGGGMRITGKNKFQFTTPDGKVIRAEAGIVILEPEKSLITLTRTPKIHLESHSLIATAPETRITYETRTGKAAAKGPHRILIGGLGKK